MIKVRAKKLCKSLEVIHIAEFISHFFIFHDYHDIYAFLEIIKNGIMKKEVKPSAMNKKDKALKYFRDHFNCSQAVFTVFGTEEGLSEEHCLKTACGFGGGIGRQQLTCGAVTGAAMVLGLRYGKGTNDPEEKKTETYALVRKLFAEFEKKNGSVSCRELLKGLDMNDPGDHQRIIEMGLFEILCEKYVTDAVEITEEIINR